VQFLFFPCSAVQCIAVQCRAGQCRGVSMQRMHAYCTLLDISLFMLRRSITSSTWLSGR